MIRGEASDPGKASASLFILIAAAAARRLGKSTSLGGVPFLQDFYRLLQAGSFFGKKHQHMV